VCLSLNAGAQTRYRQSPRVSFGESVDVMDFIPPNLASAIRLGTATTDVSPYIAAAITYACTTFGISQRVSFPRGTYPIASPGVNLSLPEDGGVGCSSLQLIGSESAFRGKDAPMFVATNDRVGTANRDAMFYASELENLSVQGFIFNGNNTKGDLLRLERCIFCDVRYNLFELVKGNVWVYATANAATDVITLVESAGSYAVGDRVVIDPSKLAGAANPSGIAAATPYWIVSKTGSNITVSASPGGSAVDFTTNGADFIVHKGTYTYDASAVNATTNTWTINNHGLTNGVKIEFLTANTPVHQDINLRGRALWVVNAATNTFQVAEHPGESAIDITTAGSGTQMFSISYAQLRGGGNLYLIVEKNRFWSSVGARGIKLMQEESRLEGESYYGCNDCTFQRNIFHQPIQISGSTVIINNDMEGSYNYPSQAYVEIGDHFRLHTIFDDNYSEALETGPPGWVVVSVDAAGPSPSIYARGNRVLGPSDSVQDSTCFKINALPAGGSIQDNACRGVAKCFDAPAFASVGDGTVNTANISGNTCSNASAEGLPVIGAATAGSSAMPAMFIQYPKSRRIAMPGGDMQWPVVQGSGLTTLNFAEGVFYEIGGASAITSITDADKVGSRKTLFSSGSGLSVTNGAIATPTGQTLKLRPNEMIDVHTDQSGVERFAFRMGEAAGQILPLTAQAADIAATGIFGGNTPAGFYRVCVYTRVTTAGSAGTMDVDIAWNDGAARTLTVINDQDLATTSFGRGCVEVETNGSSDVTYAATRTGAAGSPQYALRGTVEMLQ
jgi:hypothetical protein